MKREDILYILRETGMENILPRGKRNVQLSCPFAKERHKDGTDHTPSMGIRINNDGPSPVHCFTCKWSSGDVQGFVEELLRLDLIDESKGLHLSKVATELEEIPLDKLMDSIPELNVSNELLNDKVYPESILNEFTNRTHPYLLKRGFELESIEEWEGGYDRDRKRVTFPVRNRIGNLVGLVGRAIHNLLLPEYLNYWKFDKGRFLYGEHRIAPRTKVIVVEGLLDTIKVWQQLAKENLLNEYSVVSTLGAGVTFLQGQKLCRYTDEVILFFDNDAAGKTARDTLGKSLCDKVLVQYVEYPNDAEEDPDSLIEKGIKLTTILSRCKLFMKRRKKWIKN
jgi:DNA primase